MHQAPEHQNDYDTARFTRIYGLAFATVKPETCGVVLFDAYRPWTLPLRPPDPILLVFAGAPRGCRFLQLPMAIHLLIASMAPWHHRRASVT